MDAVLRAAAIYLALLVLFKIAGRRSLSEITSFDFVLLLVIGEATQQALLGNDFSVTNAILIIATLIALDVGFSLVKLRSNRFAQFIDGDATIVVENGKPLALRMREARLTVEDVLEAARTSQGVEHIEQIKYAILERNGKISIIKQ